MSTVIRDPEEMRRFAESLNRYVEEMTTSCEYLQRIMQSLSSIESDPQLGEAAERVEEYMKIILDELSGYEEPVKVLKLSAGYLEEAKNIKF